MKIKQSSTHESLEKALRIILSFTPANRERSVSELSRELQISIPTTSRLLKVLTAYGFLFQDEWSNKYSLGKSVFDLGSALYQTVREKMITIAQPYLDQLRDAIDQDVALEVLIDNGTILAYRALGPPHFRTRFSVGDRLPVHVAAGAKAILAFSSSLVVNKLLEGTLARLTEKSVIDVATFRKLLAECREDGLAYDFGESDEDFHFVAAPVFNHTGRPVAAVVTGDLAEKVQGKFDPKILAALKETAGIISTRLLHSARSQEEAIAKKQD